MSGVKQQPGTLHSLKSDTVTIGALDHVVSRLPPFGREVAAIIASGAVPNVFVFACHDAWRRAYARRKAAGIGSALVLPPGHFAGSYGWPQVWNGILVVADDRLTAFQVAHAAVSHGTPLAVGLFGDGDVIIVRSADAVASAA
jgi:hypothetical protein